MHAQEANQIIYENEQSLALAYHSSSRPANWSADSIFDLPLETDYVKFWQGDVWDSQYVVKEGHSIYLVIDLFFAQFMHSNNPLPNRLYLPTIHESLTSQQIGSWNSGSSIQYEISTLMPVSQYSKERGYLLNSVQSVSDAKLSFQKSSTLYDTLKSYSQKYSPFNALDFLANSPGLPVKYFESSVQTARDLHSYFSSEGPKDADSFVSRFYSPEQISKYTSIYVPSSSILAFFEDIITNAPDSLNYGKYWELTMAQSSDALSNGATAANSIFSRAQNNADILSKMGANHPSYYGAAREPYLKWKNFLAQVATYTDPKSEFVQPSDAASRYAFVYRTLAFRSKVSLSPSSLPIFDEFGANSSLAYNLLSSPASGSLISDAMEFDSSLSDALDAMNQELTTAKQTSESLKKEVGALKAYTTKQKPDLFASWDEFDISSQTIEASAAAGSIPDLYSSLSNLELDANSQYALASQIKTTDSDWAALKMVHYKNASTLFLSAKADATLLNESMYYKSAAACTLAEQNIQALRQKLSQPSQSSQAYSLAVASALQSFKSANSTFFASERSLYLGEQYDLCRKSISSSTAGLNVLSSPQALKENKDISASLALLQKYIKAGEKMNADVSAYSASYDEYYGLYQIGALDSDSLIREKISAIHFDLDSILFSQTDDYLNARKNAIAISQYSPQTLIDFDKTFSKYRDGSLWSLFALENYNSLDSPLQSTLNSQEKAASSALVKSICSNAVFIAENNFPPTFSQAYNIGGTWSSKNSMPISFQSGAQISCPFEYPFQIREITQKSQNLQSAYSANGQLRLSLGEVGASAPISFTFSSVQVAFDAKQDSCLLQISKSGAMQLSANYSLDSLFYSPLARLNIPWQSQYSSASATLQKGSGEKVNGTFSFDENAQSILQFEIAKISAGKSQASIQAYLNSPASVQKQNMQIAPSEKGGQLSVSYILNLSNLPKCSKIKIEMDEGANSSISGLKISSTSASISNAQASNAFGASWSATISPSSQNGAILLLVSYYANDSSNWLEQTLLSLEAKARLYNDSQSLSLVSLARSAKEQGNYDTAYSYISTLEQRLSSQSSDFGQSREQYEKSKSVASNSLARISNISLLCEDLTLLGDIKEWQSNIASAKQKASALEAKGDILGASSTLSSAISKTNSQMEKTASAYYSKLYANSTQLSDAILTLGLEPNISFASDEHLSYAKRSLQTSAPLDAIEHIMLAQNGLSNASELAISSIQFKFDEQQNQKSILSSKILALSGELGDFASANSALESSKTVLVSPPLLKKDISTMQTELAKPFTKWQNSLPAKGLAEKSAFLAQRKVELDDAQTLYASYNGKLISAQASLQSGANSMRRTASLSIISLNSTSSSKEQVAALEQDLNSVDSLIENNNYADAILLSDSITKRAVKLIPSTQAGAFPIEIIAITALMLIAIAYVLFLKKPPEQKPLEHKTLAKDATHSQTSSGHKTLAKETFPASSTLSKEQAPSAKEQTLSSPPSNGA